MTDKIALNNYDFLGTIFDDRGDLESIGTLAFTESPDDRTKGWQVYDPVDPNVSKRISAGEGNTYYCIAGLADQATLSRRWPALLGVYVFPLDDIGTGPGAKYKPELVPLEPSYVIETSPGNFQYGYLPYEPVRDIAVAQVLLKSMTAVVGDSAASIAAKLIRLPNGYNNKAKYGEEPFDVRLTSWNPERRYTVTELSKAFGLSPEDFDAEVAKVKPGHEGKPEKGEVKPDTVYDWLLHLGLVHTGDVDQRGYVQISCPWAAEHSGDDRAQYSPLGCGGEDFGSARQFGCFHEHCDKRNVGDLIELMFLKRYVFGTRDGVVFDRVNPGEPLASLRRFHDVTAPLHFYREGGAGRRSYYSRWWSEHVDRETVLAEGFAPGRDRVYTDPMLGAMFNSFEPFLPLHAETLAEHKLAPILDQLKYMFGSEYNNALSFLGYSVHHPEERLPFALLHIAIHHGTGRGWLKELMSAIFVSPDYSPPVNFANFMEGSFNAFLSKSLLLTFDEVHNAGKRYAVGDKIRELITEKYQELNIKNVSARTTEVFTNIIMLSNHLAALSIPDKDRRMWVVVCSKKPRPEEWYIKIYNLLEDPEAISQFIWYLKRHLAAHKDFNPKGRAPITEWRKQVQLEGEDDEYDTPIREVIEKLRAMGAPVVWRSHLIRLCAHAGADVLADGVQDSGKRRYRFSETLKELNVTKLEKARLSAEAKRLLGPKAPDQHLIYFLNGDAPVPERPTKTATRLLKEHPDVLELPEQDTPRGDDALPDAKVVPIHRPDLFG